MNNKNYTLTINEESKLITLVYWEGNTPLPVPKDPEDPLQGFEGKVMKTAVNIEGSVNQTLEALLVKLLKHFSEQSSGRLGFEAPESLVDLSKLKEWKREEEAAKLLKTL